MRQSSASHRRKYPVYPRPLRPEVVSAQKIAVMRKDDHRRPDMVVQIQPGVTLMPKAERGGGNNGGAFVEGRFLKKTLIQSRAVGGNKPVVPVASGDFELLAESEKIKKIPYEIKSRDQRPAFVAVPERPRAIGDRRPTVAFGYRYAVPDRYLSAVERDLIRLLRNDAGRKVIR